MATMCAHAGASVAGKAVVSARARISKAVGRSAAMPARVSAAGATPRAASMAGVRHGAGGVAHARGVRRGKSVIAEAVPDTFPMGEAGAPPPADEKPKGFWRIFFGKNPNEGKTRAPLKFRVLSLLPYLIPCMGAIAFTDQAFMTYPTTFMVAVAISPLLQIFYSNSFIPFVTFFTLFLAVVRNTKLNHFLRYNTMQAILLDICVMLAGLIMQYLPMFLTVSLLGDWLELFTLVNALFAIGYCMWNVIQGQYPEIPIITEAVYAQVRDQ